MGKPKKTPAGKKRAVPGRARTAAGIKVNFAARTRRAGKLPHIILNTQEAEKIVGPSLPFDIDSPHLQQLDTRDLQQLVADNLVVHEYPDPNTIEVDEHGYVVGYKTAPSGRGYAVRKEKDIVVAKRLLDNLSKAVFNREEPGTRYDIAPSLEVSELLDDLKAGRKKGSSVQVPADALDLLLKAIKLPQLPDQDLPPARQARGRGRGRKPGGRGRGGHKVPSPQLAEQVVRDMLTGVKQVGWKDNLKVGIQNGEFLNASKANFFLETWKLIAVTSHISLWIEVDSAALSIIGKAVGYGHFCCKPNSRGQAVGFLLHPRLRLLEKPVSIWSIANVDGIPDLRPGYRLHVEDKTSLWQGYVFVMHPKSMLGGVARASAIHLKQFTKAVQANKGLSPVLLGGDLNCFLDNTADTVPLTKAGYKLIYPNDHTSTQAMGGRLDGLFAYKLAQKIGHYQVFNWWKNPQIGRGVTDHGYLLYVMYDTGGSDTTGSDTGQADEVVD